MNILLYKLAEGNLPPKPLSETKLVVEDNIGESIHIHIRNVRFEMDIEDFMKFSEEIENAAEEIQDGNS